MHRRTFHAVGLVVLAAMGVIPLACRGREPTETLTVSAASSLTYAFTEIGRIFEQRTGCRVLFNFGSTGQLAQQIEAGAPVDVFFAADVASIEDLARQGLVIRDTVEIYARGLLILWMRYDAFDRLNRLEDLAFPEVRRISMANPDHAPYGMAAREALQSANLWKTLQPKLILGENVRQALQYAETGNVDVALISLSLISGREGMEGLPAGRWFAVPEGLYRPLDQALAVLRTTSREREARAFAAFVHGPMAGPVMLKYGFLLPREAP